MLWLGKYRLQLHTFIVYINHPNIAHFPNDTAAVRSHLSHDHYCKWTSQKFVTSSFQFVLQTGRDSNVLVQLVPKYTTLQEGDRCMCTRRGIADVWKKI